MQLQNSGMIYQYHLEFVKNYDTFKAKLKSHLFKHSFEEFLW